MNGILLLWLGTKTGMKYSNVTHKIIVKNKEYKDIMTLADIVRCI